MDNSAAIFTSPKKKDMKHRKRLVDRERQERKAKRRRTKIKTKKNSRKRIEKVQSDKFVDNLQPFTPKKDENWGDDSALTNFAKSMLDRMMHQKDDAEKSTNKDYISHITGTNDADEYGATTESQKRSTKKRPKHKKCCKSKRKKTEDILMHTGNISELGSKNRFDPKKSALSKQPIRNASQTSLDAENDAKDTSRTIIVKPKRRRSRTNDYIKGIALMEKHVDNFVEPDDDETIH